MANGGIHRRLTFELMRDMRALIYNSTGVKPDEIRCGKTLLDRYDELFPEPQRRQSAEYTGYSWDRIPMLRDDAVHPGRMIWLSNGQVFGVLDDLAVANG